VPPSSIVVQMIGLCALTFHRNVAAVFSSAVDITPLSHTVKRMSWWLGCRKSLLEKIIATALLELTMYQRIRKGTIEDS